MKGFALKEGRLCGENSCIMKVYGKERCMMKMCDDEKCISKENV